MSYPRVNINVNPTYCHHCGRPLKPHQRVWLELNWATNEYHKPGTVAEADSQGIFPFGRDCAKKVVAKK
jgi:hypothetical protein